MEYSAFLEKISSKDYDENYFKTILQQCEDFYAMQDVKSQRMFGYPANLQPISPLTMYFFLHDISGPLANNCGDNYERGNYQMDSKEIEKMIVEIFAKKFGAGKDFWGYITSGGSESNFCGIDMAFLQYPNGVLYFSQSAHYSIVKHANYYPSQVVLNAREEGDKIDHNLLCKIARSNYETLGHPANIVLTFGTTKYGSCDNVDAIVTKLSNWHVPFYIHVDAALFGGIPNNQIDAPKFENMHERRVNSIAVSFHKYIGFPEVRSLFLATKKPLGKYIPYIGHTDTTTSGSRAIPPFALYNHVKERLEMQEPDSYSKNIKLFASMLKARGIQYYRAEKSNIFVIDNPGNSVAKEFQLSCFTDRHGHKKAHIIIFPYHTERAMIDLADSIKCNKKNQSNPR